MSLRGWISAFSLVVAFATTAIEVGIGQTTNSRIEATEASKLVYEGIKKHNAGASIHAISNPYDQDFLYFQATWPNPVGSPVIGNFAVNPWTGDVWNAAGCERLTSRSLKSAQEGIRKRFHIAKAEYGKLHAKTPLCGKD